MDNWKQLARKNRVEMSLDYHFDDYLNGKVVSQDPI